jgi:hypothetical protein
MTFKDFSWIPVGGKWEVPESNLVLQNDESDLTPTRFFCNCGLPTFDARLKATLLRACGKDGWGEVKFIFSDARSGEDLRVDFMVPWRVARITCGRIQFMQPLIFSPGQPLDIHVWCDGNTVSVVVDDLPLFEQLLLGKHSDGWIGIGTYMATARFTDLELKQYSPQVTNNRPPPTLKSGKKFTETYSLSENVATEPTIFISQEAFQLCEADFLRIKRGGAKMKPAATAIFLTSFGMALAVVAKFVQRFLAKPVGIETWEWVSPCIGAGMALILVIIGKFLPNERKQVMKDIEAHFFKAPRTRHSGEKQK